MEIVMQYLPLGLLAIFLLFIVAGMLFGLVRGLKRTSIRVGTLVVFLTLGLLLTPLLGRALYNTGINIAGRTPAQWVDFLVLKIEGSGLPGYISPVMPYLTEFVVGLALAVLNLVLFLVIYFLAKGVSFIVYKILAKHFAPKKNKDGERIKKQAGWGLLVGAVQGLVLFFFFMIPLNGVISMIGKVRIEPTVTTAAVTQSSILEPGDTHQNNDDNFVAVVGDLQGAVNTYQNIIRYTGIEFLTEQAWNYQTTVKIDGIRISISKDLQTALRLVNDVQDLIPVFNRVGETVESTNSFGLGLAELQPADYRLIRGTLDDLFSLQILHLVDVVFTNLDEVLATPVEKTAEPVVLAPTAELPGNKIYEGSAYATLIEMAANPGEEAEFTQGLRAIINYLADQKLDLVRRDLVNAVDLVEDLYTKKVTLPAAENTTVEKTIGVALSTADDFGDTLEVLLTNVQGQSKVAFDLIYDHILDLQIFHLITQENVENLVLNGRIMSLANLDESTTKLMNELLPEFLGKDAKGETGGWQKLGNLMKSVGNVLKDHVNIVDDLNAIEAKLRQADIDAEKEPEDSYMMAALVQYIEDNILLKDENITEDEKFGPLDHLATALYDAVNTFPCVKEYAQTMLEQKDLGDVGPLIQKLLNYESVDEWKKTLRGLFKGASLMNSESLQKLINSDTPLTGEELRTTLEDVVNELDGDDIEAMVELVLSMPAVQEQVTEMLEGVLANFDDVVGTGTEIAAVEKLRAALDEARDEENDNKLVLTDATIAKISDAVGGAWDAMKDYLAE